MTDAYMDEIYHYVEAALCNGQPRVEVSIYPFRMTESNMQRHRYSTCYNFWKQLQPGICAVRADQAAAFCQRQRWQICVEPPDVERPNGT